MVDFTEEETQALHRHHDARSPRRWSEIGWDRRWPI